MKSEKGQNEKGVSVNITNHRKDIIIQGDDPEGIKLSPRIRIYNISIKNIISVSDMLPDHLTEYYFRKTNLATVNG
ncbi:hypothetical protein LAD67_16375 [Escherichia coli]|nr:hypothetical protein [Escherichia coli]